MGSVGDTALNSIAADSVICGAKIDFLPAPAAALDIAYLAQRIPQHSASPGPAECTAVASGRDSQQSSVHIDPGKNLGGDVEQGLYHGVAAEMVRGSVLPFNLSA